MSDKNSVANEPFRFVATKEGRVLIYARGRMVKTLKGKEAAKFVAMADILEAKDLQLLMAKATGQFKFGNERS